jgi:hypothetical protein
MSIAVLFVATRSCYFLLLLFQFQHVVTAAVSPTTHQQLHQMMTTSTSNNRKALSIADLWMLNKPTLVNDESNNKKFHLTYEVNDMIEDTMFTTTFWATAACSAGESPLADEGIGYKFISTNDGLLSGDGNNVRTFHVVFEITDELNIRENQNVYTVDPDSDNGTDSRIVVCVRSALNTINGMEVNYMESIIQFRYNFVNGFSVADDISLTASDTAAYAMEEERSIVDAYDCTDDPIGNSKNQGKAKGKAQGTLLRLCVQPKTDALLSGFRMRAIENYRYETKEEEGSGIETLVQHAVESRGQTTKNDLSRLTCIRGQGQCVIETLLSAAFYSQQRAVYGKGTVTYQLGQDDGTGNTSSNGNTASDNSNSGNNGRRRVRGLKVDGIDGKYEQLECEIVVRFVIESDPDATANKKDAEGLKMNNGLLSFQSHYHSKNASIVMIILIISNLMVCIVHFTDYRQQKKVVEHNMKKMYENLLVSSA